MPAKTWERDRSYRRRIGLLVPAVLVALAVFVFLSRRTPYTELYQFVGWRGPIELIPEITIIPDLSTPQTSPAKSEETGARPIPLDLSMAEGEFEANPPRIEARESSARDTPLEELALTESPLVESTRAVSYSETYVILRMVKPKYPEREREDGIEGNVTVELFVNVDGEVTDARVLSAIGPEAFQESALDAVRQFQFQPPIENGKPATMWVKFLVKFRIYG